MIINLVLGAKGIATMEDRRSRKKVASEMTAKKEIGIVMAIEEGAKIEMENEAAVLVLVAIMVILIGIADRIKMQNVSLQLSIKK
jgi:hypothetical protein